MKFAKFQSQLPPILAPEPWFWPLTWFGITNSQIIIKHRKMGKMKGNPGWQYESEAGSKTSSSFPNSPSMTSNLRITKALRSKYEYNRHLALDSALDPHLGCHRMAWQQVRLPRSVFVRKTCRPSLLPRCCPYSELYPWTISLKSVMSKPGECLQRSMLFSIQISIRLWINCILAVKFPIQTGDTIAYPIVLLSWSLTGIFRNLHRTWRQSRLIGGWESNTLNLYILLTASRSVTLSNSSILTIRVVSYYVLFPLGVVCECWIFYRISSEISLFSKIAIAIMMVIYVFGMPLRKSSVTVVTCVDVFVVKTRDLITDPNLRAWIPVSDGSL
jgi:hypothetical protein